MKLSELIERMQRNIEIWGDPEITLEKLIQIYRIEEDIMRRETQVG